MWQQAFRHKNTPHCVPSINRKRAIPLSFTEPKRSLENFMIETAWEKMYGKANQLCGITEQ